MVSEKKRKKRSWPKFKRFFFPAEIRNSRFFFPAEYTWSPKKKVFTEIQRVFPAEIRNSRIFFGRFQVILHKKRSSPKFKGFFRPKLDIQRVFQAEIRWSQKKMKKRSSPTLSELQNQKIHSSGSNNGEFFTTSAPKSLWGGLFSIL